MRCNVVPLLAAQCPRAPSYTVNSLAVCLTRFFASRLSLVVVQQLPHPARNLGVAGPASSPITVLHLYRVRTRADRGEDVSCTRHPVLRIGAQTALERKLGSVYYGTLHPVADVECRDDSSAML